MRITQQPACVLHVRPWRETSLLLECLCRDYGRIGLVARGARSGRSRIPRSVLEPFQDLSVDFSGRGELMTLTQAEPVGQARRLKGDALYSGLYLNELLVRMLARQDAYPALLERYRQVLDCLQREQEIAWSLRRFERDFLAMLGYALELRHEADSGELLDDGTNYVYEPEHGPVPWRGQDGVRVRGSDLRALAEDRKPQDSAMPSLRRLMRELIRWHCPGGDLRAWSLVSSD